MSERSRGQRLAKKRAKDARRAAQADALGFAVTATVDADGMVRDVRPGNMEHRLSDALLEIVKPLVAYPPRESERRLLETALRIGALVWNATLAAEPAEQASALDDLAQRLAQTGGARWKRRSGWCKTRPHASSLSSLTTAGTS